MVWTVIILYYINSTTLTTYTVALYVHIHCYHSRVSNEFPEQNASGAVEDAAVCAREGVLQADLEAHSLPHALPALLSHTLGN